MALDYLPRGQLKQVMFQDEMANVTQLICDTDIDECFSKERRTAKLIQQKLAALDYHYGKKKLESTFQLVKRKPDFGAPHPRGKSLSVVKGRVA